MTDSTRSTPACVEKCLEDLLDAIWEALALARSEPLDVRVGEALRSANELLDVVQASIVGSPADFAVIGEARDRLNAAGARFAALQGGTVS
jgi:hypothetical protein